MKSSEIKIGMLVRIKAGYSAGLRQAGENNRGRHTVGRVVGRWLGGWYDPIDVEINGIVYCGEPHHLTPAKKYRKR